MGVSVYHRDNPGLLVPLISSDARLIIWLGTGARTANMNYVVMQPGEANVPHVHQESEDTIYILQGRGSVRDFTSGTRLEFGPGDVVHIDPGVRVLATTQFPTAPGPHVPNGTVQMPVVWTKSYGKGRIFYCSLGHTPQILAAEPVRTLMLRGFQWAAR